jgi:hypothetical protein
LRHRPGESLEIENTHDATNGRGDPISLCKTVEERPESADAADSAKYNPKDPDCKKNYHQEDKYILDSQ